MYPQIPRLFAVRTPRPVRRGPAASPLGGERLEPRLPLAVSTGSMGLVDLGTPLANGRPTGNITTATAFTIDDLWTNGSANGFFVGLPTQNFGSVSFTTTVGTSLTFGNAVFGTFTSNTITEQSNTSSPTAQRTFYIIGTYTAGTYSSATNGLLTPNPTAASMTLTFNQTTAGLTGISDSATFAIPPASLQWLVAANDIGCTSTPLVHVINAYTGAVAASFPAYNDPADARFRGGVRVALGDVDGNPATLEVVTAPGPGRVGEVRVFDLTGVEKPSFRYRPFGSGYVSGIELAVGNLDGTGRDELVVAASRGPGSVIVASSNGSAFATIPSKSFTAFGGSYLGGATVAVGGVNTIVVGSGVGMPPTVKVYNVAGTPIATQYNPGLPTGMGGISVTAQRFTAGAPLQVMVAGGAGARSAIGVYNGNATTPIRSYNNFATSAKPNAPVFAAAAALRGGVVDTVFMAQGGGAMGRILKVDAATGALDPSFAPTYLGKPLTGPLRVATRSPQLP